MKSMRGLLLGTFIATLFVSFLGADAITIASFNVQRFGPTKAGNEVVMKQLVKIISQYDVVLIMEVVDSSGEAMDTLMASLNKAPGLADLFKLEISPRVGPSSYKEAYAFVYRKDKLSVKKSLLYPDDKELIDREPYIVQFTVEDAEFTIAGCHVAPDSVERELNEMDNVYDYVMKTFDTKNVLLMGDFNADCSYLSDAEFQKLDLNTRPEFTWLLPNDLDTTVADTYCNYDRFVSNDGFAKQAKNAEVYRFDQEMGLTQEEAEAVSDHYPITVEVFENLHRDEKLDL